MAALLIIWLIIHILDYNRKIESLLQQSVVLINEERYEAVCALFSSTPMRFYMFLGHRRRVYRHWALCLQELHLRQLARIYFTKAVKASVFHPYFKKINESDIALLDGEIDKSIRILEDCYIEHPGELLVNNNLGLIYLGQYGSEHLNLEKALYHNQAAFIASPSPNTRKVLVQNLVALQQYEPAEKLLEELMDIQPHNPDNKLYLSKLKWEQGKKAEAESLWLILLESHPEYEPYIEDIKNTQKLGWPPFSLN